MKNKNVGWLVIGIAAFIFGIIAIFNYGVNNIISATCSHGPSCSMYTTLKIQTWISIAIALVVFFIGLFLIFAKEEKEIIVKKIKPYAKLEEKKFDKKSIAELDLNSEEKEVMNLLIENKGNLFQSKIIDSTTFGKVRVTRILDSLEARGLIERKRRGMTNLVTIKGS